MKRFSVLSLVVGVAMIFSTVGFGCKKAEQPSEPPKSVEQAQSSAAPAAGEELKVTSGTLEKGGLGYILTSDKDKAAVAMKKLDTPFKNIMKVKGQMKSTLPSGVRNGFIAFIGDLGNKNQQFAKAGILIGRKMYTIDGAFVGKVEKPVKFEPGKVFDFELTVNLKEKTVNFNVDGQNVKTKMTSTPVSITRVGFAASNTKTEFSDLQISGN